MQKTILLVEDDIDLLEMLMSYLEIDGFKTIACGSSDECLDILNTQPIDLIVQDRILWGEDGLELLKEIRKKTDTPLIMMSGRSDPPDRILGIEAGADDYIAKPFYPKELVVRINAILKRSAGAPKTQPQSLEEQTIIRFGEWTMNRDCYEVKNENGDNAGLTTAEFRLLERLILSQNRALSREQLLDTLSQYDEDIFDRAIDIQVSRIRKKLKDPVKNPEYIKTVRSVGYIFIAETH